MPFDRNRKSRDDKSGNMGKKSFRKENSDKPYRGRNNDFERDSNFSEKRRSFDDKPKSFKPKKEGSFGNKRAYGNESTNFGEEKKWEPRKYNQDSRNPDRDKPYRHGDGGFKKTARKSYEARDRSFEKSDEERGQKNQQVRLRSRKNANSNAPAPTESDSIRLNRYIANSGICSRRKADDLITAGLITVNDVVVSELGAKVNPATDKVKYNGEILKREKMVYVLLNKPKDFITTTEDPQERKTVMELVKNATTERIYPVGRLDRNTTGLLLLTNDGDLAEKLSHPRNNVTKIYNVELNKNLTQGDFNKIAFGVELEDGFIKPDAVSYVAGGSKREIGIQIHSGKNRIVRRIFESLGYEVDKLDRVIYANLTKKDLPRGKWRFLNEHEIIQLKHFIK
ncbi:pseudouridine synthase [Pseudopedobacter sp.]|uniref:pseudouridine synthase n=1 Tax=Pseudopedobacter sp. TaxID=1936787 RepID=UPI0033411284